jgi:putative CocE/NonD family hydrolase
VDDKAMWATAARHVAGSPPGLGTRIVDKLNQRLTRLPASRNRYTARFGLRIPTRDGFELVTDHYIPRREAPAPTILIRSPYGRGFPINLTARAFAAQGYQVLLQSCRGTFGSTGPFQPMVKEADDGQDTVEWLRDRQWFDGRLATWGGSYLGFAQWALLQDPPTELRACVVVVGPHDMAAAMYGTGAFRLHDFLGWSDAAASQEKYQGAQRFRHMRQAERRLHDGLYGLPLAEAAEPALDGAAPWYREWLAHSKVTDKYWADYCAEKALKKSTVPTLLVGGWQDGFLEQTMDQYRVLHDRGVEVALTVGPWTHLETVGKGSPLITRESLEWLDQHLSTDAGPERKSPVRIFVTGPDEWRDVPEWPPPTEKRAYHLDDSGRLSDVPGAGPSTFRYDPADPTPAVGGRMFAPKVNGVHDNGTLEARSDVLTFTSEPLPRDTELLGSPVAELAVAVDNPHADVFVRVCDVDGRGRSRNVTDTLLRLDASVPAGSTQHLSIAMAPAAHRFAAGHRVRLQVSGGAHPRYARNQGTADPPDTATTLVPTVFTIQRAESRVVLPVA